MSAFIVSQKTMNDVVAGTRRLVKESPGYWIPKITGRSYSECFGPEVEVAVVDYEGLGNRFYAMNQAAVYARYEGRHGSGDPAPGYVLKESFASAVRSVKAMQCLRYQCSEGDCDTWSDYQLLSDMIGSLCESIVRNSPEYEAAGWD